MLADFVRRRLISSRAASGDPEQVRIRLAKALLVASDWSSWLPHILPPSKGKFDVIVSAGQYLQMISSPQSVLTPGGNRPHRLIVDGDVILAQARMASLPPAVIRGELYLGECIRLGEANLTVLGGAIIENCPSLGCVGGEYFGDLRIARSGVEKLGADLCVHRNLTVSECPRLSSVNCVASGRFRAKACQALESSGPAFSTGDLATFEACPSLRELRGTIERLTLGNDMGKVDTRRLALGSQRATRLAIPISSARQKSPTIHHPQAVK